MTWDINTAKKEPSAQGVAIKPLEVLYQYDSPMLFRTKMGLIDVLCYKLEELGNNNDLFLIAPTDLEMISALKSGEISIRGALETKNYWIVEARNYESVAGWSVPRRHLPHDFLPAPKHGLFERFGEVPDTLEQRDAFLSIKFSGPEMGEAGLSFRTFKSLVDAVYELAHRSFRPSALVGSRVSDLFDFEVAQPKFASLLITITNPIIDIDGIKRRGKLTDNSIEADIRSEIETDRDQFIDKAREMAKIAQREISLTNFVNANYSFVDSIANLTPFEGSGYNCVELNARTSAGQQRVVIDEKAGTRIRAAHQLGAFRKDTVRGRIVEVNSLRRTFVIYIKGHRQVTCAFPYAIYDELEKNGQIEIGADVSVSGNFYKRTRRDYIYSDRRPTFY